MYKNNVYIINYPLYNYIAVYYGVFDLFKKHFNQLYMSYNKYLCRYLNYFYYPDTEKIS